MKTHGRVREQGEFVPGLLAAWALLMPAMAAAEELPPLPETGNSTLGYESVSEALAALKAKPGAEIRDKDGWTIISDQKTLWSFTPENHPAHPSAVKREVVNRDGAISIQMSVLCQSTKAACDQLVRDFNTLNDRIRAETQEARAPAIEPNPRDAEVEAFATHWLDLLEMGDAERSFALLTDIFKSNMTIDEWRTSLAETRGHLGPLGSRRLRRIVWYEDPANAPLPGTYIAVEFDSVYEKAPEHFGYVILHAQGDEPWRVMRHESIVGDNPDGGR